VIFRLSALQFVPWSCCFLRLLLFFLACPHLCLDASTRRPTLVSVGSQTLELLQLYTPFLCAQSYRISQALPSAFRPSIEVRPAAIQDPRATTPAPAQTKTLDVFHRFACLRCNCARWTSRNALCAFQYIVRRIKGLAASVLLKLKWLWPYYSLSLALRSLPFAPGDPSVIIAVSEAQLDGRSLTDLFSVRIGD